MNIIVKFIVVCRSSHTKANQESQPASQYESKSTVAKTKTREINYILTNRKMSQLYNIMMAL